MNGLIEILIVLALFVGPPLVRALTSSKSKKRNQSPQPDLPKDSQPRSGEIWKELFGSDDPFSFGEEHGAELAGTESRSELTGPIAKGTKFSPDDADSKRRDRERPGKISSNSPILTENIDQEAEANSILEDFDIRKAVLYSEIMSPKFREGERL